MHAYIVLDLGFGDAGKGHLTDYLVRQHNAGVVIRYNGGAQAGHNVVTPDKRHHTFSQFGSGTFVPGVKTFLSRHVVIHPGALLIEGEILRQKNVPDAFSRLKISNQALVITPYHQAANRIRELVRAKARHGSCGVGVGEAVVDNRLYPNESIKAGDLSNPKILLQKLNFIHDLKHNKILEFCKDRIQEEAIAYEIQVFENPQVEKNWIDSLTPIINLNLIAEDELLSDWCRKTDAVVFEGAQGMLIDTEYGFYPYVSWTNCTSSNALEIIQNIAPHAEVQTIGVSRCYSVRHGPGPLPTADPDLTPLVTDHNKSNPWQGAVRYGWFDAALTHYALNHAGAVDTIALTHLDVLPKLPTWQVGIGYSDPLIQANLNMPGQLSIEQKQHLTTSLTTAKPAYSFCDPIEEQVIENITDLIGRPIGFTSHGLTHLDIRIVNRKP